MELPRGWKLDLLPVGKRSKNIHPHPIQRPKSDSSARPRLSIPCPTWDTELGTGVRTPNCQQPRGVPFVAPACLRTSSVAQKGLTNFVSHLGHGVGNGSPEGRPA